MTQQRAKNLTSQDVALIVGIIDDWSSKLTWPALCDAIARRTRQHYTRQALHAHEPIRQSFTKRKELLAGGGLVPENEGKDSLAELRAENSRLLAQLDALRDQFTIWAFNAYAKGLSDADLNRPLPDVDRDRTDELQAGRKSKREKRSKNA